MEAEHNRLLERKIHIEKRKELQEVLERIKVHRAAARASARWSVLTCYSCARRS